MSNEHTYETVVEWVGNQGTGTSSLTAYQKDYETTAPGKPMIPGSSDPAFRGDPTRWNPEELLVASLSQCHMLWFLSQSARAGIVVTAYADNALGTMAQHGDGSGEFTEVVLRPTITLADPSQQEQCAAVHERAHALCFIARSVNFPVRVEATYT